MAFAIVSRETSQPPLPVQLFRVKRNTITGPLFIPRQVLLIGQVAGELKSQRRY